MSSAAIIGRGGYRIIGVVGGAHFLSHLYQLSLPPLFPLLHAELGVSYAALGLLITAFSLSSGLGQTPMGFVVDRIGGERVLVAGLAVQAAAIAMIGFSQSYWGLLALFILAGLAHTTYHPADYAILSAKVPRARLGRAFGLHAVSGNLGSAAAPAAMVGLTAWLDWRAAFLIVGGCGIALAGVAILRGIVASRPFLGDQATLTHATHANVSAKPEHTISRDQKDGTDTASTSRPHSARMGGLHLLFAAPVLLCFVYYIAMTMGLGGIRTFSVTAFVALYDMPLRLANGALTGFLLGSAVGILLGGVVADRFGPRLGMMSAGLLGCAALVLIAGNVSLPFTLLIACLTAAGICRGMVNPVRDLTVLSITPDGAHGRIFAFVSTGAQLGNAVSPLILGWAMDIGEPRWIFWGCALMMLFALGTFTLARRIANDARTAAPVTR